MPPPGRSVAGPAAVSHLRWALETLANCDDDLDPDKMRKLCAGSLLRRASPEELTESFHRVSWALAPLELNRARIRQVTETLAQAVVTSGAGLPWTITCEVSEGPSHAIEGLHAAPSFPPVPPLTSFRDIPTVLMDRAVPALSVAIGGLGGPIVTSCFRSPGRHSPEVTPATRFQVGSLSKAVAAMTTAELASADVVQLDHSASEFLRRWALPNTLAASRAPTLGELLTHRSGLAHLAYDGYPRNPDVTLLDSLRGRPPAMSLPPRFTESAGRRFIYTGAGYSVLQQVVEDATGEAFPALAQAKFLGPLGMTHSSYAPSALASRSLASGFIGGRPLRFGPHTFPESAAAGLWSTPRDLVLLGREAIRRRQAALSGISRSSYPARIQPLGLMAERRPIGLVIGHNGGTPGYSAAMRAGPDGDKIVGVVANSSDASGLIAAVLDYVLGPVLD